MSSWFPSRDNRSTKARAGQAAEEHSSGDAAGSAVDALVVLASGSANAHVWQDRLATNFRVVHTTTDPRGAPRCAFALVVLDDPSAAVDACRRLRHALPRGFLALWHPRATEDAVLRQDCLRGDGKGANMVTFDLGALQHVANQVATCHRERGRFTCPWCGQDGLSEDGLWTHCPLFHVNHEIGSIKCPICREHCGRRDPFAVHLRNGHGPCARGEIEPEHSTGLFAIVVCRRPSDGKFLMVQEFANTGFWLPGGQLDAGESLCQAVVREGVEEAGLTIRLTGVLDVICQGRYWRRVTFLGEPANEADVPKTIPDYESTGAVWVDVRDVADGTLKLRSREPLNWFPPVAAGTVEVLPLEIPAEYRELMSDVPF